MTDLDIDILLLTETWLKEHGDEAQKAEMAPTGYVRKTFPRKNRRGGRLALLMKKKKILGETRSHKIAVLLDI